MTDNSNPLFQPTLQDSNRPADLPKPWRLNSQFWVAFAGGIVAYTIIAFINSQRLRQDSQQRTKLVVIGVVGLVLTIVIGVFAYTNLNNDMVAQYNRWGARIVAVIVYLITAQMQKSTYRIYEYNTDDNNYDSLWKAGIIAAIGGGLLQGALVGGLVLLISSLL
jgi:uncharacterized membrane protein YfcA